MAGNTSEGVCIMSIIQGHAGLMFNQYDPNAQNIINGMTPEPSETIKDAINAAVVSLVDAGYFDRFDRFGIMQDAAVQQNGLLDWIDTTKAITLNGAATWVQADGFVGSSTAGAFGDTGFIPSVDGVNYTLNSASFAVYVTQFGTKGTNDFIGGASSGAVTPVTDIYTDSTYTQVKARMNTDSPFTAATSYTIPANGLMVIQREAAGLVKIYADGVNITTTGTNNASTGLPTNSIYLGAGNGHGAGAGTAYEPTNIKAAAYWLGGQFSSAEQLAIKAIIDTYLAAI